MSASVSIYVYVLDLRGGAPPVMDGITPGIGPDEGKVFVFTATCCWTRLVCLSINGSISRMLE